MASDNFDLDWGDDPFDGELDFDMDFDGEKKGKVRSLDRISSIVADLHRYPLSYSQSKRILFQLLSS